MLLIKLSSVKKNILSFLNLHYQNTTMFSALFFLVRSHKKIICNLKKSGKNTRITFFYITKFQFLLFLQIPNSRTY